MEAFVYAVYLIGVLAAFSAIVVRVLASLPTNILIRGEHGGRFSGLWAAPDATAAAPVAETKLTTFDIPRARAA
jgi:hypothetical protein